MKQQLIGGSHVLYGCHLYRQDSFVTVQIPFIYNLGYFLRICTGSDKRRWDELALYTIQRDWDGCLNR